MTGEVVYTPVRPVEPDYVVVLRMTGIERIQLIHLIRNGRQYSQGDIANEILTILGVNP